MGGGEFGWVKESGSFLQPPKQPRPLSHCSVPVHFPGEAECLDLCRLTSRGRGELEGA